MARSIQAEIYLSPFIDAFFILVRHSDSSFAANEYIGLRPRRMGYGTFRAPEIVESHEISDSDDDEDAGAGDASERQENRENEVDNGPDTNTSTGEGESSLLVETFNNLNIIDENDANETVKSGVVLLCLHFLRNKIISWQNG